MSTIPRPPAGSPSAAAPPTAPAPTEEPAEASWSSSPDTPSPLQAWQPPSAGASASGAPTEPTAEPEGPIPSAGTPGAYAPAPAAGYTPPGAPLYAHYRAPTSHRRRNSAIVGGVLAFVVVLLLILWYTGSPPFATSSSSNVSYGAPMLYSQTVGPLASADGAVPYGPWTPIAVLGVASPSSLLGNAGLGTTGCTAVWTGPSTAATIYATPSGAPVGSAAAWFVFSTNGSGGALFTGVTDTGGAVQVAPFEVFAITCLSGFSALPAIVSSPVDSSDAANAAASSGGAAFLEGHPGVTSLFTLTGADWSVTYTTCAFGATSGTLPYFAAEVNATTGSLLIVAAGNLLCSEI